MCVCVCACVHACLCMYVCAHVCAMILCQRCGGTKDVSILNVGAFFMLIMLERAA